jgi:hypothetical protein
VAVEKDKRIYTEGEESAEYTETEKRRELPALG